MVAEPPFLHFTLAHHFAWFPWSDVIRDDVFHFYLYVLYFARKVKGIAKAFTWHHVSTGLGVSFFFFCLEMASQVGL